MQRYSIEPKTKKNMLKNMDFYYLQENIKTIIE